MTENVFRVFIVLYYDYCSNFGPPAAYNEFIAAGATVEHAIKNAVEAVPGISSLPIAYTEEENIRMDLAGLEYIAVVEKTYSI